MTFSMYVYVQAKERKRKRKEASQSKSKKHKHKKVLGSSIVRQCVQRLPWLAVHASFVAIATMQ